MLSQRGILFRFIVKNSSGNESQMSKRNKQADELKGAIAGLEAQRSLLGDTVVEALPGRAASAIVAARNVSGRRLEFKRLRRGQTSLKERG